MNKKLLKKSIKNKKILLIGGNGLLGSVYSKFLQEKVKFLSIIDLSSNNIRSVLSKKNVKFFKSNILDKESFTKSIETAINHMKGIDVLINNAALTSEFSFNEKKIFDEFNSKSWNESISVTLTGSYLGCINVIPHMLKQKSGQIINISSHYGVVSPNHNIYINENFNCPISYSVAKSGVIALTKWLATKYAKFGIRVNCISPGGVENKQSKTFIKKYTNINPSKKMANKNDFNGVLEFLISDESNYFIGHNFIADGGASVW